MHFSIDKSFTLNLKSYFFNLISFHFEHAKMFATNQQHRDVCDDGIYFDFHKPLLQPTQHGNFIYFRIYINQRKTYKSLTVCHATDHTYKFNMSMICNAWKINLAFFSKTIKLITYVEIGIREIIIYANMNEIFVTNIYALRDNYSESNG